MEVGSAELAAVIASVVAASAAIAAAWLGARSLRRAREQSAGAERVLQELREAEERLRAELERSRGSAAQSLLQAGAEWSRGLQESTLRLTDRIAESADGLQDKVRGGLDRIREENSARLEEIRRTVDEKLHSTLETRLGDSFRIVSERLEEVHRGLGEMQSLAGGVGDLKRVLTNVRTRGTFGEVQLGAILDEVLAPEQFERNVVCVAGSAERVEYAVRLPGRDPSGDCVYLPVDAKFPQEDYQRLQAASEVGDAEAVQEALKALRARIVMEARRIREKYVSPPRTTDFALLFFPTEGLYAETLRSPGLCEELQSRWRVVPVGPVNLVALLNCLQMGFRTLALEKRSSEVWEILRGVKGEMERFGESLAAVDKKLQEAAGKVADAARRSRGVQKALRSVESVASAAPGEEPRDAIDPAEPQGDSAESAGARGE